MTASKPTARLRNLEIVVLRRRGASYNAIGRVFGVSAARARQVVLRDDTDEVTPEEVDEAERRLEARGDQDLAPPEPESAGTVPAIRLMSSPWRQIPLQERTVCGHCGEPVVAGGRVWFHSGSRQELCAHCANRLGIGVEG